MRGDADVMTVEKWGVFEAEAHGRSDGNPYLEGRVTGRFTGGGEDAAVAGFYDGDGVYRVRFMPRGTGEYRYRIEGDCLDAPVEGAFTAVAPGPGNHGPVRADGPALRYADGTPHASFGTTCYAWAHQSEALQQRTLETLRRAPFNKLRFCLFPKFYEFNRHEPLTCPFLRGRGEGLDPALVEKEARERVVYPGDEAPVMDFGFDYTRPNPEHFRRIDRRVRRLMEMGIEADLILMHPYDRWGMNDMGMAACESYLRYVTARYAAFRNVWWSLANEYDFVLTRTDADWERFGAAVAAGDPYGHMCSLHNGLRYYDYSRPWITHLSLQRVDFYRTTEYTDEMIERFGKPVVWDEICYEGDIGLGWGNIGAEELVRRFWEAFMRGGHAGHGETFLDPDAEAEGRPPVLWWSHGGELKGESAQRIAFLRRIVEAAPGGVLRRGEGIFDEVVGVAAAAPADWQIHYLGLCRPAYRRLFFPDGGRYAVDVIDTWNMTVEPAGEFRGACRVALPGRPYMAIRVRRLED